MGLRQFSAELSSRASRAWTWVQGTVESATYVRREWRTMLKMWVLNTGLPIPVYPVLHVDMSFFTDGDSWTRYLCWYVAIYLYPPRWAVPGFLRPEQAHISVVRVIAPLDPVCEDAERTCRAVADMRTLREQWQPPSGWVRLGRHRQWHNSWNYGVNPLWEHEVAKLRAQIRLMMAASIDENLLRYEERDVHVSWL